jgi:hypothetical protein
MRRIRFGRKGGSGVGFEAQLATFWLLLAAGIAGGIWSRRLRPSGRLALALGAVPLCGLALAFVFC